MADPTCPSCGDPFPVHTKSCERQARCNLAEAVRDLLVALDTLRSMDDTLQPDPDERRCCDICGQEGCSDTCKLEVVRMMVALCEDCEEDPCTCSFRDVPGGMGGY